MRRLVRQARSVALFAAMMLGGSSGWADVNVQDKAAARSLFDEARRLAQAGQYAEACPKFEESQRVDPGAGTLFNLADCYEHVGKTAGAWSLFLEVASQSKLAGQADREKVARKRAADLERTLSKLSIVVPPSNEVTGLEVRRDGSLVGKPTWGQAVPVDTGEHTIEVSAPERKVWTTTVKVDRPGATESVTIPQLETVATGGAPAPSRGGAVVPAPPSAVPPGSTVRSAPVPPSALPTRPPESSDAANRGSTQRTAGLVTGGVGVVCLGLATFFSVRSKSKLDDAKPYCNGNQCWDQRGVDLHDQAVTNADIATVTSVLGIAGLVGGALLYVTAPSGRSGSAAAGRGRSPVLMAGPGGLAVKGVW